MIKKTKREIEVVEYFCDVCNKEMDALCGEVCYICEKTLCADCESFMKAL